MTERVTEDERHTFVARQFATSALGEITAFSLCIGAVYMSEKIAPAKKAAFVGTLAEHLGKWRGVSAESQTHLAKNILDVGIMNVTGASGMAVQYGLRRAHQPPEERTPFWYEAGRLAFGRIVGTVTAIGTLVLANTKAPGTMKTMEKAISYQLGSSTHTDRFATLLVSNAVQSVGAVAGNAPAQLLYDRVICNPPEKSHSR